MFDEDERIPFLIAGTVIGLIVFCVFVHYGCFNGASDLDVSLDFALYLMSGFALGSIVSLFPMCIPLTLGFGLIYGFVHLIRKIL